MLPSKILRTIPLYVSAARSTVTSVSKNSSSRLLLAASLLPPAPRIRTCAVPTGRVKVAVEVEGVDASRKPISVPMTSNCLPPSKKAGSISTFKGMELSSIPETVDEVVCTTSTVASATVDPLARATMQHLPNKLSGRFNR